MVLSPPEFWRYGSVHLVAVRTRGAVAQLGERLNGIQEVDGSIPFGSTKLESTSYERRRDPALVFCSQFCSQPATNRAAARASRHSGQARVAFGARRSLHSQEEGKHDRLERRLC